MTLWFYIPLSGVPCLKSSCLQPVAYDNIILAVALLCGGWVPETSGCFHSWQHVQRWRLHWWLAKHYKPSYESHSPKKTGTHHTDKQWKGRRGGDSTQNAPFSRHTDIIIISSTTQSMRNPMRGQIDMKPLTTIIGHRHSWLLTQLNFINYFNLVCRGVSANLNCRNWNLERGLAISRGLATLEIKRLKRG